MDGTPEEAVGSTAPPSMQRGVDPGKLEYVGSRADPGRLADFVAGSLRRVGVPADDAELVAEILVDADLHGIDTHGVALLYTHYIQGIQAQEINPSAKIRVDQGSPTTVSVDGDRGLGMLVSHRSMTECIRMAGQFGTGWATVHNSTHSAAGAYYARMAAAANMIGFHWSTGGSTIAVPGGSGRLLGNNPFSFAAPAGPDGPFVLDMAPSTTIRPKLRMLEWEDRPIPDGWCVDDDGQPITDPGTFFDVEGAILPLGSTSTNGAYKGFGLLLISDILTGVLSGDGGSLVRRKGEHSHAFAALRIDAFPTGGEFADSMSQVVAALRRARTSDAGESIRFPGERGNRTFAQRSELGIPLRRFVVDELAIMAEELELDLESIWSR